MKSVLKACALAAFASCILCASQIVGVTVNSIDGFVGPFPSGPESITIQLGTNDYETATGYETSLRLILPVDFEFPEFELTSLAEAAQSGLFNLSPMALQNYELGAALLQVPGGIDVQKDYWNIFNGPVFALDAGMISALGDAEKLLSTGSVDFADVLVLTPLAGEVTTAPEFEVKVSPDPVSTPEPATFCLIGAGLIGIGVARRRKKAI